MLFIDARAMGRMTDRTHRELTAEDIKRTSPTPTTRGAARRPLASTPTCPASASRRTSRRCAGTGTCSRPVATSARRRCEDDGEPFEEKMARLAAQWREQRAEAERLDAEIEANLRALGYGP